MKLLTLLVIAVGRDGVLRFANDVYDRDDALIEAVRGAALPPAEWAGEARALRGTVSRLVGGCSRSA